MTSQLGFAPTIGAHPLPQHHVRPDLSELAGIAVSSPLDRHIVRLLALHPDLQTRFGQPDLQSLTDETKQTLIADMSEALGLNHARKPLPLS